MDLVINDKEEEKYKIKVGAEIYEVAYPSWKEANVIEKELAALKEGNDNDKMVEYITDKLVELGLNAKFFELKAVKAKHIFKVWSEINSIKK